MLKKVRVRLTLLSGIITTLILIIMTAGYLYTSEKNLYESYKTSLVSDIYTIAANMESQNVISHAWLSRLEAGKYRYIEVLDNNSAFLFNSSAKDGKSSQSANDFWQQYRRNEKQLAQNNISYKCYYKSFASKEAYCFVITVQNDGSLIEMLLAAPVSSIEKQVLGQRLVFVGIILPSLLAIWLFAWIYTGKLLKPIEESRIRQNRFTMSASHELRTPLAVILSCSESALNKIRFLDNAENDTNVINLRHNITTVKNEALRSSRLLSDMLTLSSSDAGHLDIRKADTELDTLLLNACEAFENLAAQKGIRLNISLPDAAMPPCCCDAERITQVIAILLHNAVSYTPDGGSVNASISYAKKGFYITISDTGIGIPDADKPHIFERFYRAEKARSDKNHSGLGLSIAYEIAAAHNGSIAVSDNKAHECGTIFTVRLP